jgi:hypothetical protein
MDRYWLIAVLETHTLSSSLIVLVYHMLMDITNPRIVVLGFALVIVQAALQSQHITVYKLSLVQSGFPSWSSSICYLVSSSSPVCLFSVADDYRLHQAS